MEKKKELKSWLQKKNMKISGWKSVLVYIILRSINFDTSKESLESEDSGDEISYTPPDFDSISSWDYVTFESCVNIGHEDLPKSKNCHRQLKKAKKFCNDIF